MPGDTVIARIPAHIVKSRRTLMNAGLLVSSPHGDYAMAAKKFRRGGDLPACLIDASIGPATS
jgi:hypothetical protein